MRLAWGIRNFTLKKSFVKFFKTSNVKSGVFFQFLHKISNVLKCCTFEVSAESKSLLGDLNREVWRTLLVSDVSAIVSFRVSQLGILHVQDKFRHSQNTAGASLMVGVKHAQSFSKNNVAPKMISLVELFQKEIPLKSTKGFPLSVYDNLKKIPPISGIFQAYFKNIHA